MDKEFHKRRFQDLADTYSLNVSRAVSDTYRHIVIPFCQKYKMNFDAGMGSCSFETVDGTVLYYNRNSFKVSKIFSDDVDYENFFDNIELFVKADVDWNDMWDILDIQTLDYRGFGIGTQMDSYEYKEEK